jgi:uncharacterized protein
MCRRFPPRRYPRAPTRTTAIPYSPLDLLAAALVALLAAILQGVLGFGYAVLGVPLLTLIDPSFTPVPVLLVALPQTVAAAWRERGDLDLGGVGWIIGGRIPGSVLGAWVLTVAAQQLLDGIIATVVLIAVLALGLGWSVRLTRTSRTVAGFASGFSGTTSAIGGPPIALLYRDAGAGTVRSSLGAVFALGILVNLAVLAAARVIVRADWVAAAVLLVPTMAGFWLSSAVKGRFPDEALKKGILVVAGLAAIGLALRALSG